jgi:glycosyltransferase involved in cell wall biosynthesis
MDDCSTDNSREIILEYETQPKVTHVVLNEVNSGSPFIQWQKGFDLAKGEYIWIAESDDYADLNLLETAVMIFKENSNVGVVYCDSNIVDVNNRIHMDFYKGHRNRNFYTSKWSHDYIKNGIQEIKENLIFDCTINNMSATVFKKSLLGDVDFEQLLKFTYCGDWYFLIALTRQCDVAYISKAMNYFQYGVDNFKTGTKSVLNYNKEREWVKYFFWQKLEKYFTEQEKKQLYEQLADELRIQINDALKGKTSLWKTLKMMNELRNLNRTLFNFHVKVTLCKYLCLNKEFN